MLPTKDDSEISRIYGNTTRRSRTASSKRVPSRAKPPAVVQITAGAARMPTAVTSISASSSIPATWRAKACVASGLLLWRYSASIGTKACENAPSAKIRRKRLGSLKATTKASIAAPAPKIRATTASRTKPNTRENIVILLKRAKTARRFMAAKRAAKKGGKFTIPDCRQPESRFQALFRLPAKAKNKQRPLQNPPKSPKCLGGNLGGFCKGLSLLPAPAS